MQFLDSFEPFCLVYISMLLTIKTLMSLNKSTSVFKGFVKHNKMKSQSITVYHSLKIDFDSIDP